MLLSVSGNTGALVLLAAVWPHLQPPPPDIQARPVSLVILPPEAPPEPEVPEDDEPEMPEGQIVEVAPPLPV